MEFLGVLLVVGFMAMLAIGAMSMPLQRPPVHRQEITCPEDYRHAIVSLSWNVRERRMEVVKCEEHRNWMNGDCGHNCERLLQKAFPVAIPTTVIA